MTVKQTENKQKNGRHKLTEAGPGRAKGSKNKFTNLKQAYLDVFEEIEKEGKKKNPKIKTFFKWATKNDRNQGLFYQMVSKMLPTNLTADLLPDADSKLTIAVVKTKDKDENKDK